VGRRQRTPVLTMHASAVQANWADGRPAGGAGHTVGAGHTDEVPEGSEPYHTQAER